MDFRRLSSCRTRVSFAQMAERDWQPRFGAANMPKAGVRCQVGLLRLGEPGSARSEENGPWGQLGEGRSGLLDAYPRMRAGVPDAWPRMIAGTAPTTATWMLSTWRASVSR